jgi:hypothetical protein
MSEALALDWLLPVPSSPPNEMPAENPESFNENLKKIGIVAGVVITYCCR